jgi:Ca2+-binding RTX toxin-like protein
MKKPIQLKEWRGMRSARPAATAAALAAFVAGAAGIAAGNGNAAPSKAAGKAAHHYKRDRFERPRLQHGELTVEGTGANDTIALRLQAGDPSVLQVDVGDDGYPDFSFKRKHIARIVVRAGAGDDNVRIDDSNGAFTDSIPTTLDGGAGGDRLAGGQGAETLLGGDGNDSVDGNGGADLALLGAGDDTFIWDPGDGSDKVEGQDGADTMRFNGAAGAEHVDLSANGSRLRFFRDAGNITMDTNSVETVDFNALGGADTVTVNDLTGTGVSKVDVDLAAALGGSTGDGSIDRVIVNGTNGDDRINVDGDANGLSVSGLAATVGVVHAEAANDRLEINTLAGTDTVNSGSLSAGVIQFFKNGVLVP